MYRDFPSIGGTMNIITDFHEAMEKGGKFKQEFGDGGFLKTLGAIILVLSKISWF